MSSLYVRRFARGFPPRQGLLMLSLHSICSRAPRCSLVALSA
ncbi:MAG: hypothetical protein Q7S25_05955 [Candidatus Limnocylindria bacterium]|nr:hypothetical protein [Candidatus Limnocylindria bacterium]